ncbi:MAG: hypothetical protein AAF531_21120 [Actinomycetota bacterium]
MAMSRKSQGGASGWLIAALLLLSVFAAVSNDSDGAHATESGTPAEAAAED